MKGFDEIHAIAENTSPCACGRTHRLLTGEIRLEEGALKAVPDMARRVFGGGEALIICDVNTYAAAGAAVERLLSAEGLRFHTLCLPDGVTADEKATKAAAEALGNADFLIAVGSGTVSDVTRYTAAKTEKHFLSVPTAPSMDGYVSSVAAMTFGGCKVTTPAVPPSAVAADIDVLAKAPKRLLAAGAGDILGKFTCLCDWEVSALVSDETCCARLSAIERRAAEEVLASCGELSRGGKEAVEKLMYALLVSGLAMQLNGDSRPASGAEHHLSHFWEMRFLRDGRAPALHGAKVGVATVIIADLYHRASGLFVPDMNLNVPDFSEYHIRKIFGPEAAEGVIRENTPDPYRVVDVLKLYHNCGAIVGAIAKIPPADDFARALETLGGPVRPADLGIDHALELEGLENCIYIRRRMTVLRLLRMFDSTQHVI